MLLIRQRLQIDAPLIGSGKHWTRADRGTRRPRHHR